ncbi:unnamed protein product, partial [Cyprideis torosa]
MESATRTTFVIGAGALTGLHVLLGQLNQILEAGGQFLLIFTSNPSYSALRALLGGFLANVS